MIAGGKPNLIGISGKMGSGKDTLYIVMNYVADKFATESIADWEQPVSEFTYANKKYSEKLKYMVCFLLGCDRSDLEDREFKEKELGEEWWKWEITFEDNFEGYIDYVGNEKHYEDEDMIESHLIKLTPRKLLQLLGTEAGRQIIHPNIWVNGLFADYKHVWNDPDPIEGNDYNITYRKDYPNTEESLIQYGGGSEAEVFTREIEQSNWIVTDVRFPNEAQAIKDRGGIVIRVNRNLWKPEAGETIKIKVFSHWTPVTYTHTDNEGNHCGVGTDGYKYKSSLIKEFKEEHPSETALDDYDGFDYVINNDTNSVQDLVDKVKQLKIV